MLPNFICPGAPRSATTTLYYLLIQHPQIYLPSIKETRFFTLDYEKGLSWYEQKYYANTKNEIAVGDISPIYLVNEKCPERIYKDLGQETKFIFMLRNPVERAYSHYYMLKNHQFENLSFEEAISIDEDYRKEKSLKYYQHEYGFQYLKDSCYFQSIQRYLKYFPKDQFKYVIFEEFIDNLEGSLSDILNFLDVNDDFKFNFDVYKNQKTATKFSIINQVFYCNNILKKTRDFIQKNTGWRTQSLLKKLKNTLLAKPNTKIPLMDQRIQEHLYSYFKNEIEQLEILTDKNLSIWKKYPENHLQDQQFLKNQETNITL
jgi:hypothetical protein